MGNDSDLSFNPGQIIYVEPSSTRPSFWKIGKSKGKIKFSGFTDNEKTFAITVVNVTREPLEELGRIDKFRQRLKTGKIGVIKAQDEDGSLLYYSLSIKSLKQGLKFTKEESKQLRDALKKGSDITEVVAEKLLTMQKESRSGDVKASYSLGMRALRNAMLAANDEVMKSELNKAKDYFLKIETRKPDVAYQLGMIYKEQGDVEKAKEYLQRVQDNPHALFELGNILYEEGSRESAIESYKKAAEKGHVEAMKAIHQELSVLASQENQSFEYLEEAAHHGDKQACLAVSKAYRKQFTDEAHLLKALEFHEVGSGKERVDSFSEIVPMGDVLAFPVTKNRWEIPYLQPLTPDTPVLSKREQKECAVISTEKGFAKVRLTDLPLPIKNESQAIAKAARENKGDITALVQKKFIDHLELEASDPADYSACYHLAKKMVDQKRFGEAIEYFTRVQKCIPMPRDLDPEEIDFLLGLVDKATYEKAVIYEKAGLKKEAAQEYLEFIQHLGAGFTDLVYRVPEFEGMEAEIAVKIGRIYAEGWLGKPDHAKAEKFFRMGAEA